MESTPKLVVVADDNILVRMLLADTLEDAGFKTIEACNAAEAALALQQNEGAVGVLFTDIDMPGGITGLELAHVAHRRWPYLLILVTSGNHCSDELDLPPGGLFVEKPYNVDRVAAKLCALTA